jgi:hypothetical protein
MKTRRLVKGQSEVSDSDLTPDDPGPQIGFHKAVPPGGTMLITIKLPFKE